MSKILQQLHDTVFDGRIKEVAGLTTQALQEGLAARVILEQGLIPAMGVVGAEFKKGRKFVPEMMLSARTMHAALDILRPALIQAGEPMVGKVVIGTVKGDLHSVGKNLVAMMLEGSGFEVIDLGIDVGPDKFLAAVEKEQPEIVAMSALLTTTMRAMGQTIETLDKAGCRDKVKVMVGGAPLTVEFATQIGADAFAANAPSATEIARKFVARA
jgi:5-methyltetrahydrofolate--homocysteine methyltransferase